MGFNDDHAAAYVCCHVFTDERPILFVTHEDGDWVFAGGGGDHRQDQAGEDWHIVGVGHLTKRDASLEALSDLPLGWEAE